MTVLQVCAFAAPNAGNFIASLTRLEEQLAEKGIQTIYAFSDGARDKAWCQEIQKRTKVYFLPTAKARILPKTYQIMRRVYAENDVDIVHSHFELYDMPATVTAPKGAKVFWHLHDALKRNYQNGSASRKIMTRIQYKFAGNRPRLLSVSEEHAEFAKELGFPAKQITYFPNGISTERIRPTPLNKTKNQFLMFGWEVIRKGVDLVVQAAEDVQNQDLQIVIVGQEECKQYLSEHCSAENITFLPPVDNINELYADTKVFLHVSRAEGLSYALLEVIYAGIPVICSDIPENNFARAFRNIYFVGNEDVDAIATRLFSLAQWDGVMKEEDVRFNQRLIERDYSIEAWAQKLLDLYLE